MTDLQELYPDQHRKERINTLLTSGVSERQILHLKEHSHEDTNMLDFFLQEEVFNRIELMNTNNLVSFNQFFDLASFDSSLYTMKLFINNIESVSNLIEGMLTWEQLLTLSQKSRLSEEQKHHIKEALSHPDEVNFLLSKIGFDEFAKLFDNIVRTQSRHNDIEDYEHQEIFTNKTLTTIYQHFGIVRDALNEGFPFDIIKDPGMGVDVERFLTSVLPQGVLLSKLDCLQGVNRADIAKFALIHHLDKLPKIVNNIDLINDSSNLVDFPKIILSVIQNPREVDLLINGIGESKLINSESGCVDGDKYNELKESNPGALKFLSDNADDIVSLANFLSGNGISLSKSDFIDQLVELKGRNSALDPNLFSNLLNNLENIQFLLVGNFIMNNELIPLALTDGDIFKYADKIDILYRALNSNERTKIVEFAQMNVAGLTEILKNIRHTNNAQVNLSNFLRDDKITLTQLMNLYISNSYGLDMFLNSIDIGNVDYAITKLGANIEQILELYKCSPRSAAYMMSDQANVNSTSEIINDLEIINFDQLVEFCDKGGRISELAEGKDFIHSLSLLEGNSKHDIASFITEFPQDFENLLRRRENVQYLSDMGMRVQDFHKVCRESIASDRANYPLLLNDPQQWIKEKAFVQGFTAGLFVRDNARKELADNEASLSYWERMKIVLNTEDLSISEKAKEMLLSVQDFSRVVEISGAQKLSEGQKESVWANIGRMVGATMTMHDLKGLQRNTPECKDGQEEVERVEKIMAKEGKKHISTMLQSYGDPQSKLCKGVAYSNYSDRVRTERSRVSSARR